MKGIHILIGIIVFVSVSLNAQEIPVSTDFSFGFQISQYQKDFGIGLNATSPYFAHDRVAIRIRGNLMYNEHLKDEKITWSPYFNFSVGVVGVSGYVAKSIKLYGEGGLVGLIPSSNFSEKDIVFGGYGLFGFEFYPASRGCYFIELGGVGTGATADKIPASPIYSNGLLISTGLRFHIR